MRVDKRAERMYRALDSKLRVRAALRRWKAGRKPDPLLLHTMPRNQADEFNRLVRLVARAANQLTARALVLRLLIPQLEQELDLLNVLRLRAAEAEIFRTFVRTCVPEPITRQEYRGRDEEMRRAAGREKEPPVSPGDVRRRQRVIEVRRFRTERTRDVPQALALLKVSREGASNTGEEGAELFDEWLDAPPVPMSEAAAYFEVYADSAGAAVRGLQKMLRAVHEILASDDSALSAACVANRLASEFEVAWHELRSIEIVADELSRKEFAGEDPLRPTARKLVDEVRSKLITMRESLETHGARVEVTEPPDAMVRALRRGLMPRGQKIVCATIGGLVATRQAHHPG